MPPVVGRSCYSYTAFVVLVWIINNCSWKRFKIRDTHSYQARMYVELFRVLYVGVYVKRQCCTRVCEVLLSIFGVSVMVYSYTSQYVTITGLLIYWFISINTKYEVPGMWSYIIEQVNETMDDSPSDLSIVNTRTSIYWKYWLLTMQQAWCTRTNILLDNKSWENGERNTIKQRKERQRTANQRNSWNTKQPHNRHIKNRFLYTSFRVQTRKTLGTRFQVL